MFAPVEAKLAAVRAARGRSRIAAALTVAALLSGCIPATTRLTGMDPADPTAKVAAVGHRSTIAPYASLRPAAPTAWRERNDGDAPQRKSER